jgi:hypothetical protein
MGMVTENARFKRILKRLEALRRRKRQAEAARLAAERSQKAAQQAALRDTGAKKIRAKTKTRTRAKADAKRKRGTSARRVRR